MVLRARLTALWQSYLGNAATERSEPSHSIRGERKESERQATRKKKARILLRSPRCKFKLELPGEVPSSGWELFPGCPGNLFPRSCFRSVGGECQSPGAVSSHRERVRSAWMCVNSAPGTAHDYSLAGLRSFRKATPAPTVWPTSRASFDKTPSASPLASSCSALSQSISGVPHG